jgi:hypothetical protein
VTFNTLGAESLTATDNSTPSLSIMVTTNVIAPPNSTGGKTNQSGRNQPV